MGEKNVLEYQFKRRSATHMAVQLIESGVNGLHGDFAQRPVVGELGFQRGSYSKKP